MKMWRLVVEAENGGTHWLLVLACGHACERPIRYRLDADIITGEAINVPLPAPRKVRCQDCPTPPERTAQ